MYLGTSVGLYMQYVTEYVGNYADECSAVTISLLMDSTFYFWDATAR